MKISYFFILLSFLFVQCSEPARDDSKNDKPKDEETVKEKAESKKIATHRFLSTEMRTEEYLTMRQNEKGDKEWFYSSAKNPKDVKMGVTSINGQHAIYFLSTPQVIYVMDLEDCGFMLTDEEDNSQWYRQIEPTCGR